MNGGGFMKWEREHYHISDRTYNRKDFICNWEYGWSGSSNRVSTAATLYSTKRLYKGVKKGLEKDA